MYKSQKIELRPTKSIKLIFDKNFSYSRYIYNKSLETWNNMYKDYTAGICKAPTYNRVRDKVKRDKYEWEEEYLKMVLETSVEDVSSAFNMFFKKLGKFPKFKSKRKQSDTIRFFRKNEYSIQVKSKRFLKLQGIKDLVKMKEDIRFNGTIKECTISKKGSKYYASFVIELPDVVLNNKITDYCGIDLGVKDLLIINGDDDFFRKYKTLNTQLEPLYKKISYYQKVLSRKVYNSNKYNLTRTKLNNTWTRITNIKNDYIHKLTTNITRRYKYITIEDLAVGNMMKNKHLSKAIAQQNWGQIREFLKYKSKLNGNILITADRYFPSTQICSSCGFRKEGSHKMKLGQHTYVCDNCGDIIDRDYNAALNLKQYGKRFVGLANEGNIPSIVH
jgi:putative transposase